MPSAPKSRSGPVSWPGPFFLWVRGGFLVKLGNEKSKPLDSWLFFWVVVELVGSDEKTGILFGFGRWWRGGVVEGGGNV